MIYVYDAKTFEVKWPLRGHSPNNEQCTCQHYDEDYEPDPDCPVRGHSAYVYSVCFSSDGKQLTSGSDDTTVRNWDLATRASLS